MSVGTIAFQAIEEVKYKLIIGSAFKILTPLSGL